MNGPLFSVIIPSYNQAEFLSEAIQSVFDQTYQDFEIIVVNDCSQDKTTEVVKRFNDPRLLYIEHKENRGLPASRNTGIKSSSGDFIALLDADDLFARRKLEFHKTYLEDHPEIGVSYNARYELNHSEKTIRDLWRPPVCVSIVDLVCGFPFSPSDMVIRREWAYQIGLFNESYVHFSEDLDFQCRLSLAGCKFGGVDKALNFRRYHSGRTILNLEKRLNAAISAATTTIQDPRCPGDKNSLRKRAYANHYSVWACNALLQKDTVLGQKYLLEASHYRPSLLDSRSSELIEILLDVSIKDEKLDHELVLRNLIEQLPKEFAWVSQKYDWAVARGYLLRGIRAFIWGRPADGIKYFSKADDSMVPLDKPFLNKLSYHLVNYASEFGESETHQVIRNLSPSLKKIAGQESIRWLIGYYSINRAFWNYQKKEYSKVPVNVFRSVLYNPSHLANRGLITILLRSFAGVTGNKISRLGKPSVYLM